MWPADVETVLHRRPGCMKRFLIHLTLLSGLAQGSWAQAVCTSDGQAAATALVERFISADCERCWGQHEAAPEDRRTLTLDWIVPSAQGDAAALSAAALRDAQERLDALARPAPATSAVHTSAVIKHPAYRLRVAHGTPVGLYVGAVMELSTSLKVKPSEPLNAWLLLVETVPAGSDGTPVARNLVRNVLISTWVEPDQQPHAGEYFFRELRPLNIPANARTERLRLIGWLQDAQGRLLTAVQSVCTESTEVR